MPTDQKDTYQKKTIEEISKAFSNDPNKIANILSRLIISNYDEFGKQWITFAVFFLAALPGMFSMYLFVQRYLSKNLDCEAMTYSQFFDNGVAGAFAFLAVLMPFVGTIFALIYFKRFMMLNLAYPLFVGQILGLLFVSMTSSKTLLEWYGKTLEIGQVMIMILILVVVLILMKWFSVIHIYLIGIILVGFCAAIIYTFAIVPKSKQQVLKVLLFHAAFTTICFCGFLLIVHYKNLYAIPPFPEQVVQMVEFTNPDTSTVANAFTTDSIGSTSAASYSALPKDE